MSICLSMLQETNLKFLHQTNDGASILMQMQEAQQVP